MKMKTKNKIILSLVGLITSLLIVTFVMINIVNIGSHNDIIDDVIIEEICEPAVSFSRDSWETIACNINKGNISAYNVGDTKEVTLDGYGTQTLRIANMSTPDICNTKGFSQSACGLVLEFADIITVKYMNFIKVSYPEGTSGFGGETGTGTNKGGWPASTLNTFVNNDIYNSLPGDLRNMIIDTTVISGHGERDSANFTSTDKLYLLDAKEVYGTSLEGSSYLQDDTASDYERQLDYYLKQGVTIDNYSALIKQNKGTNGVWWLRSAYSYADFFIVNHLGVLNIEEACNVNYEGVSPAFRIG